jgi:hypothetical protein
MRRMERADGMEAMPVTEPLDGVALRERTRLDVKEASTSHTSLMSGWWVEEEIKLTCCGA